MARSYSMFIYSKAFLGPDCLPHFFSSTQYPIPPTSPDERMIDFSTEEHEVKNLEFSLKTFEFFACCLVKTLQIPLFLAGLLEEPFKVPSRRNIAKTNVSDTFPTKFLK